MIRLRRVIGYPPARMHTDDASGRANWSAALGGKQIARPPQPTASPAIEGPSAVSNRGQQGETGNFSGVRVATISADWAITISLVAEVAMGMEWTVSIEGTNEFGGIGRRETMSAYTAWQLRSWKATSGYERQRWGLATISPGMRLARREGLRWGGLRTVSYKTWVGGSRL